MLENEIKLVNEIINERKSFIISENRLRSLCIDFDANLKIVVAILESEYNAVYIHSDDPHYCGSYQFDNPNLQKQDYFDLNYIFKEGTKVRNLLSVKASSNYYEIFAKEILRLEDIETPLEDIMKTLEEKNAFIGEERIWFITSEMGY